jgi:tripartite-type tricarboxylate transporter receptor subunit TctC
MKKVLIVILSLFLFNNPCVVNAQILKPITIYVPFAKGGASEQLVTIIAQQIQNQINQPVIVALNNDNTVTPIDYINQVKSKPNDGFHLIMGNLGTHASSVAFNSKSILYDPLSDFEPIAMLGKTPMYLVVRSNFPANNFQEFVRYLYDNPDKKFTVAHAGEGSTSYLAGIYFAAILKLDLEFIPYPSSDPALKDLAEGYIDIMIDQTTSSLSYIQGGLIKPLIITSEKPSALTPKIPCSHQVGLHEFNINGWNMLFVPKGVDKKMQLKLNYLIVNALNNKFVQAEMKLLNTVIVENDKNTLDELKDFLKKEIIYWQEVNEVISHSKLN